MVDPGLVPGLIGVGLQMLISEILRHIKISRSCRKSLRALEDTLIRIKSIIVELPWNKHEDEVSAVDSWFKELEAYLNEASEIVKTSTMIPSWDPVSHHQTSTKIASLTKDIEKHLALSGLVHMVRSQEQTQKIVETQKQIVEAMASLSMSQAYNPPIGTINRKKIEQGNKTLTGTASGLSNLPGVSSFQDQQLDCHLTWDEPPSYESTMMLIPELYENPMAGCVKEDRTENQWFGRALCDFSALSVDELSLTAGEEVEILEEREGWFYVSKKWPGGDGKVAGWVPAFFVNSSYSSFPMAATKHLQGDKTITGTASGLSNLSKDSLFQDQQLESLDSVSNDVEEEDRTENQWFGQALCDFPARRDDELNLTAGEEVEILQMHGERFYVSKKQPGTNTKVAGWVHKRFVNSYYSD